jgi:polyhydroxyalkanoate synthesis regulator phasin
LRVRRQPVVGLKDKGDTMKDLLRKAWFFGVGVFDFTKEKVEGLVQEMVERGEITQQEGPEAVKQLLAKAQEAQQGMVEKTKELVKKAIAETKFAKASDLAALGKRVAALEREIQDLREMMREVSGE